MFENVFDHHPMQPFAHQTFRCSRCGRSTGVTCNCYLEEQQNSITNKPSILPQLNLNNNLGNDLDDELDDPPTMPGMRKVWDRNLKRVIWKY